MPKFHNNVIIIFNADSVLAWTMTQKLHILHILSSIIFYKKSFEVGSMNNLYLNFKSGMEGVKGGWDVSCLKSYTVRKGA